MFCGFIGLRSRAPRATELQVPVGNETPHTPRSPCDASPSTEQVDFTASYIAKEAVQV